MRPIINTMDFPPHIQFAIWKLIGLAVLAFFGCFFYTLFTGRSLMDDRTLPKDQGRASSGDQG